MKFKLGNKGIALSELTSVGLLFVLLGVVLSIGAYINTSIRTAGGFADGTVAYWAINNATGGILNLSSWLPLIAIVIAAGVVISVLVSAFKFGSGGV